MAFVIVVNRRKTAEVERKKYKVRGGGPKLDVEMIASARALYEGGKPVHGPTYRQEFKEGTVLKTFGCYGQVGSMEQGYEYTKKLSRMAYGERSLCRTYCDEGDVNNIPDMLKRVLMHRGYQQNDVLYDRIAEEGAQNVQVNTLILWRENGQTYQLWVDSIKVKKVIRTEFTVLLPTYWDKATSFGLKTTHKSVNVVKNLPPKRIFVPAKDKITGKDIKIPVMITPKERYTAKWKVEAVLEYGVKDIKPMVEYDYFIDSHCIKGMMQKVTNARMALGTDNGFIL